MATGKHISEANAATIEALRVRLGLVGGYAGSFSTALPIANISTDKAYAFTGTNAASIGGIAWYNGDSALYNGSTWLRIPFQSLANYYTKVESNIGNVFYNGGFGFSDTASILLVMNAIKSISLVGDWDTSKRYVIRYFSRNEATNKYAIIIYEASDAGTGAIVYNSTTLPISVTENTGKATVVTFPKIGNKQVIASVNYSELAAATGYNFGMVVNWVIKPESVMYTPAFSDYTLLANGCFYDAGWIYTDSADLITVYSAIKGISLIGDWDKSKKYAIRNLSRNHATQKYSIILMEMTDAGANGVIVYNSTTLPIPVIENTGFSTIVTFPKIGNKQVRLTINYSAIADATGYNFYATQIKYVIRPENIDDSEYSLRLKNINHSIPNTPSITDKRGFVMFRVDDSHLSTELLPMSNVFDKYGVKMVNIFNPSSSSITTDILNAAKDFQSRGHQVGDHTPSHGTGYVDVVTDEQVTYFTGMAGVKSIVGKRIYLDWIFPDLSVCIVAGKNITITAGSSLILADFTTVNAPNDIIYTAEKGWVHLINKTATQANAVRVERYWDYTPVVFASNSTEQLYKTPISGVYLGQDATNVLLQAAITLFEYYNIGRPRFWAMQGNYSAIIKADALKAVGEALGYIGGISNIGTAGITRDLNYNLYDSDGLSKWSQTGITFYVEENTLEESKIHISEMVAKHRVAIDCGHFWYKDPAICPQFTGTDAEKFAQYLALLDGVLLFCRGNNIPILTHDQATDVIFGQKQNPFINIIPNLYTDLATQSKPDGYVLGSGASWVTNDGVNEDKLHSIKRNGNGALFTITDLGGIEKGKNNFKCWLKGTAGAIVTFDFGAVGTLAFTLSAIGWNEFIGTITIPYTTNLLTITPTASSNIGNDISVSGMCLSK